MTIVNDVVSFQAADYSLLSANMQAALTAYAAAANTTVLLLMNNAVNSILQAALNVKSAKESVVLGPLVLAILSASTATKATVQTELNTIADQVGTAHIVIPP